MKVVSWNVCGVRGIQNRRHANVIAALSAAAPDILLLQEIACQWDDVQAMADGLKGIGLGHTHYSGGASLPGKKYGNVIASRWPITTGDLRHAKRAPWIQLLARASVAAPEGRVDVLNAHIPNGSGNGWKKIETFEALAEVLVRSNDAPRILAGDFNEPRQWLPDGRMVTFGLDPLKDGTFSYWGPWRHPKGRETGDGYRWDSGVRAILAGESIHGLRNVYRSVHGYREHPVTHRTRKSDRCFDHMFVSGHFKIEDSGYFHEWREERWSDHSAIWATLSLMS